MNSVLFLYRGENFDADFYYFSGVDIDHAFFVQKGEERFLLVPKMNEALARKSFSGKVIACTDFVGELKKIVRGKMLVNSHSISASLYQKLSKYFRLEDASAMIYEKRMKKKNHELACVSKAARITKEIFNSIDFSRCKTELEVKKYLLRETLERGLEQAFEPIVATDKNSSYPHYKSGDVKLGSIVLIDYGVRYKKYCSDLTRCFFLKNDNLAKEAKMNYDKLLLIFDEIMDNFPDFENGGDVAKFTKKLFVKYKLPSMIHSIGHGVGLDVHELPRLGEKSKDKLKNTILAIEPAVYFKGYGIRFEETVYFDGKRARVL